MGSQDNLASHDYQPPDDIVNIHHVQKTKQNEANFFQTAVNSCMMLGRNTSPEEGIVLSKTYALYEDDFRAESITSTSK
ncbi:hypothetical protein RRG08_012225 [Elysia crispata]|uniref:Uncharacterized protein n=1 Tax=Elysia crispata TaxID=231223 RepID=A0AAE0XXS5_9GAST|nr:hypothetical protein RRG08_012225 [Elysia crispata]